MRGRIVGALAVALIAGAAVLDAVRPAEPARPRAAAVVAVGGTLVCPVATIGRGAATLHLANVGRDQATARVSVIPRRGAAKTVAATLRPGAVEAVVLHGRVQAPASAIVEYAGGELVATHTLWLPGRGSRGAAAAACGRPGPSPVVVAHATTLGADTRLALVNPGSAPADVSISLLDDGALRTPERLSRRVIPPRSRRDFLLGDFAFDARDLTAVVSITAGQVVVEGFVE